MSMVTVFSGARIVDPSRGMDATGTVIVRDGLIEAAGPEALNQGVPEGARLIDCTGKTVLPGLVDGRVFVGEPGGEHRETIASASEAAAAGGITSIVTMPDTDPVIDDVALVEFVLRTARDTACVHVHPAAAVTKGLAGREMTEIGLLSEAGAVAFTEGRNTLASSLVMRRALTYARDFGAVILHETQDKDLASAGVMNEGLFASWLGLPGIPREAELIPLARDLMLARLTGGAYHAAKISTKLSADAMRLAKGEGVNATAGVCRRGSSCRSRVPTGRSSCRRPPPGLVRPICALSRATKWTLPWSAWGHPCNWPTTDAPSPRPGLRWLRSRPSDPPLRVVLAALRNHRGSLPTSRLAAQRPHRSE